MFLVTKSPADRRHRAPSSARRISSTFPVLLALICLVTLGVPAARAGAPAAGSPEPGALSQADTLRLGERIFREGLLPSGKTVQAVIQDDLAVDGRMFPCANCHKRSGLGSTEGGVVTLPNAGSKLFQPSYYGREFTPAERSTLSKHYQTPLRRPAYTEETLARAIREGVDPTGRVLNPVMPRFNFGAGDLALLIAYLKTLSAEPSPGVLETTIRFATVVTSEVPAADRDAMLATLDAFVADWNSRAPVHAARARYPEIAQDADLSYRTIALSRWQLDGPPASWRGQLEAHYRREPVFALLGGISTGEWRPVHEFSEALRLPCILPITDLPVLSGSDWYTLYFSKGLYQEGEAAAVSLGRATELAPETEVLQLYRDSKEGRALAAGFEETWRSLGRKPPVNRVLDADGPLPPDLARQLTGKKRPQVLLLWLGQEAVPVLESLAESESRPGSVYLSSTLLKQSLWTLPEPVRDFSNITFPFRLAQDEAMHASYAKVWLRGKGLASDERRISTRMYSLLLLMNEAIPKMRRNFYRDHFLEVIGLSTIHDFPDYERLSFQSDRRYASRECYIVTLSRGPSPILIRKSD